MTRPLTPANSFVEDSLNDPLHTLVTRIASGDRAAFRTTLVEDPCWPLLVVER